MSFSLSHLLRQSRQRLAPFSIQVLLPSLALTGLQIFLISLWSQEDDYASIFKGLTQWDSHWYLGIVRQGYQFVGFDKIAYEQSNVAFFPGYPLAVIALSRLLRVEPELGLYLTAQLFCWLMWVYLLLLYRLWQIPLLWQVLASLMILVYPSSFYLVVGYSESLFMASLLGFFYWSAHLNSMRSGLLAGIHGLVMSATRIVGLPVALVPLLRLSRPWFWTASAVVLALSGGLSFFLYCQLRFGRWDLYLEMQRY
ncbi:mannosyltransferase family protein, partial [Synechococcus sp. H55.11]|uniref:mannosyltransferase family protein n=3 Tax=unclassified Synechococcus TaxID=2626047 RepID=UPI0039C01E87